MVDFLLFLTPLIAYAPCVLFFDSIKKKVPIQALRVHFSAEMYPFQSTYALLNHHCAPFNTPHAFLNCTCAIFSNLSAISHPIVPFQLTCALLNHQRALQCPLSAALLFLRFIITIGIYRYLVNI